MLHVTCLYIALVLPPILFQPEPVHVEPEPVQAEPEPVKEEPEPTEQEPEVKYCYVSNILSSKPVRPARRNWSNTGKVTILWCWCNHGVLCTLYIFA